ncbi:hypothetical protein CL654_02260 [bacterium]|nr:hypothetical protein [bacterium]|tara:strand:+ start:5289 stop:5564 length:276 start_codon:yes stop_codon:yes gene_type:complete
MPEPNLDSLDFGIPGFSYDYLGTVLSIDAIRWISAVLFLLVFIVFIVTLITTTYHLRRYSLTKTFAIKAEVIYLVVSFVPLVVILSVLLSI